MYLYVMENRGDIREAIASNFLLACAHVGWDPSMTYVIRVVPPIDAISPAMGDFIAA